MCVTSAEELGYLSCCRPSSGLVSNLSELAYLPMPTTRKGNRTCRLQLLPPMVVLALTGPASDLPRSAFERLPLLFVVEHRYSIRRALARKRASKDNAYDFSRDSARKLLRWTILSEFW